MHIRAHYIAAVSTSSFYTQITFQPSHTISNSHKMKQTLFFTLAALAASAVPALAQKPGPIKLPGLGTCPDECISIRVPTTGALVACCGTAEGCIDCAPACVAACGTSNGGNGRYGGCVDLGGSVDNTCTKGCELLCDADVSDGVVKILRAK